MAYWHKNKVGIAIFYIDNLSSEKWDLFIVNILSKSILNYYLLAPTSIDMFPFLYFLTIQVSFQAGMERSITYLKIKNIIYVLAAKTIQLYLFHRLLFCTCGLRPSKFQSNQTRASIYFEKKRTTTRRNDGWNSFFTNPVILDMQIKYCWSFIAFENVDYPL